MNRRDEFDDPEGFQSAFGKIAEAMEQGHQGLKRRGPALGILTACVALFVLFAVFWSTYPRAGHNAAPGPVPLIRADATPYKTVPANPGGMDIPYRDSTVFQAMNPTDQNKTANVAKVESLLPPPENPIPKAQMFAGLKTAPLTQQTAKPVILGAAGPEQAGPDTPPPVPEAKQTQPLPEPKPADVTAAHAAAAEPAAGNAKDRTRAPPARPAAAAQGGFYIQLASVRDRAAATAAWKKMQKKFPARLGHLTLRLQKADLGARGIFYRIQGGKLTRAEGKETCAAITAKRAGGCLVVQ